MKTTITAVIFDMDGVLFDTERMYMECWREAAEPRGLKNVDEISKACIGRTLQGTKEVFEAAKAEQGIDVSFEELHEDCSRRFKKKEEREGLPEKPGVHEILEYLDGECSLEDAVYTLKRDTRHFAKRQLTWFRRESEVTWIDKGRFDYNEEKILEYMIRELGEKEIYEKQ